MYGYRLRALFEIFLAFALGVYLTFFAKAFSWSENAVDLFDQLRPLLNGLLLSASWAWKSIAHGAPDKDDVLYKVFSWFTIRIGQMCHAISYGFGAILLFSLGSDITPDWLHNSATGFTVICLLLLATGYFKTGTILWSIFTWTSLATGLWLAAAVIWGMSLVKYPEFSIMVVGLALALIMLFRNNLKDK